MSKNSLSETHIFTKEETDYRLPRSNYVDICILENLDD